MLTERQIRALIKEQRPPKIYSCRECGDTDLLFKAKTGGNICRPCAVRLTKSWYQGISKGRKRVYYFRYNLRYVHHITAADYMELYRMQHGKCIICKRTKKLVVDHNHTTGKIRGLLCSAHNRALGYFQDSPELLDSAADYLRATM